MGRNMKTKFSERELNLIRESYSTSYRLKNAEGILQGMEIILFIQDEHDLMYELRKSHVRWLKYGKQPKKL